MLTVALIIGQMTAGQLQTRISSYREERASPSTNRT
jgi:hypothetical protein